MQSLADISLRIKKFWFVDLLEAFVKKTDIIDLMVLQCGYC